MFERFTEDARQVVVLAQEESRRLRHNYIGTEHILLGLLRQEELRPEAERSLGSFGITLQRGREAVERIVGPGDEPPGGQIPFTPRAKKVLEVALREALQLGHGWIGPEHILLGLISENDGVAARVLLEFPVDEGKIRERVTAILAARPPHPSQLVNAPRSGIVRPIDAVWLAGLDGVLARLTTEIRQELGRDPDLADLLLVIACAGHTAAGEAVRELGIDVDALWATVERIRQRRADERAELARRINEAREQKENAIERQEFDQAARLRDEQRELTSALRPAAGADEALREVRRRLGIAEPES